MTLVTIRKGGHHHHHLLLKINLLSRMDGIIEIVALTREAM